MPDRRPVAAGRRDFLLATLAAGGMLALPRPARAAQIAELDGRVLINRRPANRESRVFAGDRIEVGPASRLVFTLRDDAFLLRAGSELRLEKRSDFEPLVAGLRLVTGALAVAFGKGRKRVTSPTATAGIRGTGIYLEARPDVTYFCTCYGAVDLAARGAASRRDHDSVVSTRHVARFIHRDPRGGSRIESAPTINHTDEELAMLEGLLGRACPLMAGR